MKKKITFLVTWTLLASAAIAQQTGSLRGRVTDSLTTEPLVGATVKMLDRPLSVTTGKDGSFTIDVLPAGAARLLISYVGYQSLELPIEILPNQVNRMAVHLSVDARIGNEVVVSASKRPEKITFAPASIQVIGVKALEQFAGSNVVELISTVQGIEYTRNGVAEINLNARGFNSAFNNKVFQLVDGRNSMSALSASLPVMNRGSTNKDDLERIEIILGPQSALYGPNAHNAVLNFMTKDPRKYQGTTVSVSAGSQSQFSMRIRQATQINEKWAFKLTGEHSIGREFNFLDSVYAGNQPPGVQPFFGPAVTIPERNVDLNFRQVGGEGQVYYRVTPQSDLIVSGGYGSNNRVQVTTSGRNQMQGVTYSFLQARYVHPRFFAQVYQTSGSLGTSYAINTYTRDYWNITHSTLTTGPNRRLSPDSAETYALRSRFKENSRRINAEMQYNYQFKKIGLFVVAGLNYQKELPNGYGTTLIDSTEKIRISQYGAVLQLDKSLPWGMRAIATTRIDRHENFGSFLSPRFALLKKWGEGNLRVTWGRAYAMPSILTQYAGIGRFIFGNGKGIEYIRTNAKFSDPASIAYTTPLKPEQVSTWEIGYKGTIGRKWFLDINYYNGVSKNFISPTRSVAGRVIKANGIPVTHSLPTAGAVINDTLRNASFLTYFNYGEVKAYGLDLGLTYTFNRFFHLSVKYSWFGSDITENNPKNDANLDGYVSQEERSMNAARNRAMVILQIDHLDQDRLFVNVSARFVEQYDFYSGSQIGTEMGAGSRGKVYGGMVNNQPRYYLKNYDWGAVGDFVTIDCSATYQVNPMVRVNIGVTNLLNSRQIEFVGSPSIGRLFMAEMKVHIPNGKGKR